MLVKCNKHGSAKLSLQQVLIDLCMSSPAEVEMRKCFFERLSKRKAVSFSIMIWTAEKLSPSATEPTSYRTEAVLWQPGLHSNDPGRVLSRCTLLLFSLTTNFHFCWSCCFLSAVDLLVGSWAGFSCLNCNILLSFITFAHRKLPFLQCFLRLWISKISINSLYL